MAGGWAWVLRTLQVVGLSVVVEAALSWLLRRQQESSAVREAIFFPSRMTCVQALLAEEGSPTPKPCDCPLLHQESPFSRLVARLLTARWTLDLCVFSFSYPKLCCVLLLLHRRGVHIRVITDAENMAVKGSQIGILRKAGIQVRHNQENGYMHHKFVIIDKKVLITGSLNWTNQAIQLNRENVLITDDKEFVIFFLAEFENIWEEYNPTNYTFFTN